MIGHKTSGFVWNYFTSQGNKTAKCNICQKLLSYRTTITNLKTHLKLLHESAFIDLLNASGDNESGTTQPPAVQKPRSLRAHIWTYFKEYSEDKATCNLCRKVLLRSTTIGNLKSHLQLVHESAFTDLLNAISGDTESGTTQPTAVEKSRSLRAHIWAYFKQSSLEDKATCNLCRKVLLCSSSVATLASHFKRMHTTEYAAFLENNSDESDSSTPTADQARHGSTHRNLELWKYFSKSSNTDKTALCNICSKNLSYRTTITNLKTHLRQLHSSEYEIYLEECIENAEREDSAFSDCDKTEDSEYLEMQIDDEADSCATDPIAQYSDEQEIFDGQIDEEWLPTISDHSAAPEPTTSKKRKRSNVQVHQPVKREIIERTSSSARVLKVLPAHKNKLMDVTLLKLFTKSYQPFSIIEEENFIDFVKALNPSYNLPDIKQVADRLIPDIYEQCLEEQKQIVKEQAKYVCLTTDTWTSSTMDAFMAVTIHFLTEELDLKSVMLTCSQLKGSHTVENLVSELNNIAEEWEISDKISFCVTDNDSNMISAVKLLGWTHYECCVNNLNLIVKKALDKFEELIDKVKVIVNHFHTSCGAKEKLIEYQQFEQGIAQPSVLTICDPRSWISIYSMLEGLTTSQEAVQAVILMTNMNEDLPVITKEEWSTLRQLCVVLKPFEETARILNTENYVAAGKVIMLTNGLRNVLEKLRNEDFFPKIEEIVNVLSAEIDSCFDDVEFNENLALCTVLDPRFKLPAFKNETAAEIVKATLINKVKSLIDYERVQLNGEVSESKENTKSNQFSIWSSFKESAKIMNPSQSSTSLATQEVEIFLNDSLLDLDEDPIGWWRERRPLYQHLRTIFMENCHILANSVPCESLFTGQEISERRTHLTTTKVNQLVFLHANMRKCDYERLL